MASPLCPCLSSSVFYKDPVPGFRATPLQEDLISDPSLHHSCRDPISKQAPFPRLCDSSGSLGPTFSSAQHLMRSHSCLLIVRPKISAHVLFVQHHWDAGAPWNSPKNMCHPQQTGQSGTVVFKAGYLSWPFNTGECGFLQTAQDWAHTTTTVYAPRQ